MMEMMEMVVVVLVVSCGGGENVAVSNVMLGDETRGRVAVRSLHAGSLSQSLGAQG